MNALQFSKAGWHKSVIEYLATYSCGGLEIRGEVASREQLSILNVVAGLTASITRLRPQTEAWVFWGHDTLQPKNRLTEYAKLWKSVGLDVSNASSKQCGEWVASSPEGIRHFGFVAKDLVPDDLLLYLWRTSRTCWLVFVESPDLSSIADTLNPGWEPDDVLPPDAMLQIARDCSAILVRQFGPTEEGVLGAVAVARTEFLQSLLECL